MSLYPNEMVPLQIDRAIDAGRYLEAATVNLADRDPAARTRATAITGHRYGTVSAQRVGPVEG